MAFRGMFSWTSGLRAGVAMERQRVLKLLTNPNLEINALCKCGRCKAFNKLIKDIEQED